jgi:hypothetical protein
MEAAPQTKPEKPEGKGESKPTAQLKLVVRNLPADLDEPGFLAALAALGAPAHDWIRFDGASIASLLAGSSTSAPPRCVAFVHFATAAEAWTFGDLVDGRPFAGASGKALRCRVAHAPRQTVPRLAAGGAAAGGMRGGGKSASIEADADFMWFAARYTSELEEREAFERAIAEGKEVAPVPPALASIASAGAAVSGLTPTPLLRHMQQLRAQAEKTEASASLTARRAPMPGAAAAASTAVNAVRVAARSAAAALNASARPTTAPGRAAKPNTARGGRGERATDAADAAATPQQPLRVARPSTARAAGRGERASGVDIAGEGGTVVRTHNHAERGERADGAGARVVQPNPRHAAAALAFGVAVPTPESTALPTPSAGTNPRGRGRGRGNEAADSSREMVASSSAAGGRGARGARAPQTAASAGQAAPPPPSARARGGGRAGQGGGGGAGPSHMDVDGVPYSDSAATDGGGEHARARGRGRNATGRGGRGGGVGRGAIDTPSVGPILAIARRPGFD